MSSSYSESDGSDSMSTATDGTEAPKPKAKPYKMREEESVQSSMDSDCSHICTVAASSPNVDEPGFDPSSIAQTSQTENRVQSGPLGELPSELVTIIARHLSRSNPAPFPPPRRDEPCPCGYVSRRKPISPEESSDASLSLSCTSKRLREIVFNDRRDRTIVVEFCEAAFRKLLFLNATVRGNVK
jgi:hypothetical protein